MLICSSGEGVFITLQFSFSFCYYSHTGNYQLENNVSKRSRFDYDPRALADRGVIFSQTLKCLSGGLCHCMCLTCDLMTHLYVQLHNHIVVSNLHI